MKKIILNYTLNCTSNTRERIDIKLCMFCKYIPMFKNDHDYTEGLQIDNGPIKKFTHFRKNKNIFVYEFENTLLKIFSTKNGKVYINVVSDNSSKYFDVSGRYNYEQGHFPPPCPYDYHMEILFNFFREIQWGK